ncbi:putative bifunctional diguanylate cyclase/phosphodiesterase [Leptothrix discophora]|uniref:EAL domain-containing protein n=1 Tax=Leptothrix discophora TaxID=89 RepID=A0ABT9G2R7_LEPDI|nr:EAL domain-containing protein [Leptothrix discophora]MDP4300775.1 EAL domain-containing protein [Leptothrix discophora]
MSFAESAPTRLIRRIPIAARLGAAFALVLLVLGLVLAQALQQTTATQRAVDTITQDTLHQVMLAQRTQNTAQAGAEQLFALFVVEQPGARAALQAQIDATARDQQVAHDALVDSSLGTARQDAALARVTQARSHYLETFDEALAQVALGTAQARPVMVERTMPALHELQRALEALVEQRARQAGDDIARLHALHEQVRLRLLAIGAAAVLLALLSAVLITRSIARPLRDVVRLADAISAGRLDTALPPAADDEVGRLTTAMDQMRHSLARREARIAELAFRDELTGLANRTLFGNRLETALAQAAQQGNALSVLVLNLDRFKQVNEVLGHRLGDEVLKEVAARLRDTLARTTDAVARLGGDEFGVLLPTRDPQAALALGRRLLAALESPVPVQDQRVDVSASIGIACADASAEGLDPAQLMARADLAMNEAKSANHGVRVFEPGMERHVEHGLTLLSDLRRAAEADEFFLLFQPKLRLRDGHCDAAEVLVRWRHPQRGVVPPDRFIPFAEQTGAIKAITRWVLQQSLRQLARWQREGQPELSLNVNVSTRDLMQPDFPAQVERALRQAGVSARHLCLEVTESAIMDDPLLAMDCLQALNRMGVRLAIDDFGTGYSSLAYLKRLPVQELKIDRSFISGLDRDEADVTIVRSTIDMAHHMGLSVVAEGIETEAVGQRLRAFGCDQAQGYLYSRPLPAADFMDWLRQHRDSAARLTQPA